MWEWFVSITPIAVLFSAIAFFRIRIPLAGAVGLGTTLITSGVLGTLTVSNVSVSVSTGLSAALSILYAIWPAIFLYEFMRVGGSFTVLKDAAVARSQDGLILVLLFGWVFASFLQSITGFGVPVAVCAPLLIALGVRAVPAVTMTLIGHAWGNTFGTLGMAWDALVELGPVSNIAETSLTAGLFLWIVNFSGAVVICMLYGGLKALRHGLPFVVVMSIVMAGGQILIAQVDTTIAAVVPTAAALVLVLLGFKMGVYTRAWSCPSRVVEGSPEASAVVAPRVVQVAAAPFAFLAVVSLAFFALPQVGAALTPVSVWGIPVLHHAGTVLTLTALFSLAVLKLAGRLGLPEIRMAIRSALRKLTGTSLGIIVLLVMARLLFTTGHIDILAQGVASVAGVAYLPFAAAIGTFGAFVTSSNLSSNILLTSFQNEVATELSVSPSLVLAAQTAGGAAGAVLGPATILLGSTTAGVQGREGEILRPLILVSLGQAALIGLVLTVWVGVLT